MIHLGHMGYGGKGECWYRALVRVGRHRGSLIHITCVVLGMGGGWSGSFIEGGRGGIVNHHDHVGCGGMGEC